MLDTYDPSQLVQRIAALRAAAAEAAPDQRASHAALIKVLEERLARSLSTPVLAE
jgi:hypothetical protein